MTLRDTTGAQKRTQLRHSWIASSQDLDQLKETMSAMDAGFRNIKEQLDSFRAQTESASSGKDSRERQSSNDSKFKLRKFSLPSLQRGKCHDQTCSGQ